MGTGKDRSSRTVKAIGRQAVKSGLGRGVIRTGGRVGARMSARGVQVISNLLRSSSRVYSLTVLRGTMRVLMGNIITAVITLIVFTLFDAIFLIRKERSVKQFLVNILSNIWVIFWGTVFFVLVEGSVKHMMGAQGTLTAIVSFIAGFVISVAVCVVAGILFDKAMDRVYVSDTTQMTNMIASEYETARTVCGLDERESDKLLKGLEDILNPKVLRRMFRSSDRQAFAKDLLNQAAANTAVDIKVYNQSINACEV
ncbi:MAG: hypothetical protein K5745_00870 [Saccharofermentans sp.]|nr:hypothetical protein [Saccharofermentans sp.]